MRVFVTSEGSSMAEQGFEAEKARGEIWVA